jgi:hypothetical protein
MLRPGRPFSDIPLNPRQEVPLPGGVALPLERLDPPPPHRGGQHGQVAGLTSLRERGIQLGPFPYGVLEGSIPLRRARGLSA